MNKHSESPHSSPSLKFFAANQIDDPANLADDSVFLFSGTQDSTVSVCLIPSLKLIDALLSLILEK